MNMKNKTYLFVDGSNLYAGQYELFGPDHYLEFFPFIQYVEKKLKISFDKIYFYASYSPRPQKPSILQKQYLKNEAFFYRGVKQAENVIFFTGYRSKTSGKEKEVDVKLTADIISLAFLNRFNTCYLLTGDADFLQALFTIHTYCNDKKIFLLCLENKIMHKGSFYFKTYITKCFNTKFHAHPKQKLEEIHIAKKEIIRKI